MAEAPLDLRDRKQFGTFKTLLKNAEAGDEQAMARLRATFEADPKPRLFPGVSQSAEDTLLHIAGGESTLAREAWKRETKRLEDDLAGPNPTPLERLLARRVALCWLHLNYFDSIYAQNLKNEHSWASDEHAQRRQDRAHARLLSAIRTLALVRRLAVPPLRAAITNEKTNRAEFIEPYEVPQTVRAGG